MLSFVSLGASAFQPPIFKYNTFEVKRTLIVWVMELVVYVEAIVKVDKQGWVVLPKDVRKAPGIEGEAEVVCRVGG